ncbi:hypothetical protein SPW_4444 [Streptomyces sp. W007]|nr:hypothetical protein SPW_4444 [Streptomyces sp. W007]
MSGHRADPNSALTELRSRLHAQMAHLRLNQTDLARKAGLGRTTVSEALLPGALVPTARTITVMAAVLKLPAGELLELRRRAAEHATGPSADSRGPGMPIGLWDPHDLEVHPAGTATNASGVSGSRVLPGYVRRAHDQILDDAVKDAIEGRSRMVVLVGTSSTGKTRASWEAVQPLAPLGWKLWHPFDPTRAEAALEELHQVCPRTVVWLNEAQHYLGPSGIGERIAAAAHQLLVRKDHGPLLILGTLWPQFDDQYAALPAPKGPDPHSRVRELLAGRTVTVPDAFDKQALATATNLAEEGELLLADALSRTRTSGRLTQDLAGAPVLLKRYEHGSPGAKVLLEVAMDARRLGMAPHIPQGFLTAAVTDYFTETDYDELNEDWVEAAYAELARPVHGKQVPLRRTTPRPQRNTPTSSLYSLTNMSSPSSPLFRLADYLDQHGRETRRGQCPSLSFWQAAYTHVTHAGDLANLSNAATDRHRLQWAHILKHRGAQLGDALALYHLAGLRAGASDWKGAETLYRRAAALGNASSLYQLAALRQRAGDLEGMKAFATQAADHARTTAAARLAERRQMPAIRKRTRLPDRQPACSDALTLTFHASLRAQAGDYEGAERLYTQAVNLGHVSAMRRMAALRESLDDLRTAKVFYRQAASRNDTLAQRRLTELLAQEGDRQGSEVLALQAAVRGDVSVLTHLSVFREEAGDKEGAEVLAFQAADFCGGDVGSEVSSAVIRQPGPQGFREADVPDLLVRSFFHSRWPHGLDPDGSPTLPWQCPSHECPPSGPYPPT